MRRGAGLGEHVESFRAVGVGDDARVVGDGGHEVHEEGHHCAAGEKGVSGRARCVRQQPGGFVLIMWRAVCETALAAGRGKAQGRLTVFLPVAVEVAFSPAAMSNWCIISSKSRIITSKTDSTLGPCMLHSCNR